MASNLEPNYSYFGKKIITTIFLVLFFLFLPLFLSIYEVINSKKDIEQEIVLETAPSSPLDQDIIPYFASLDYEINAVRRGHSTVPQLYLPSLPLELVVSKDSTLRKKIFILSVLPLILKVNKDIIADRKKLSEIVFSMEYSDDIADVDQQWLRSKMKQYLIGPINIPELYSRMNIIPPSLALTQSAIETGWGSSRFAQQGNALFGQWTWDAQDGLVPRGREEGKNHLIRKFDNLIEAVYGYAMNLNTHPAYADFRLERNRYADPTDIDVNDLLITLIFYSELGYEYIDNLSSIIRVNKLTDFDQAKLRAANDENLILTQAP